MKRFIFIALSCVSTALAAIALGILVSGKIQEYPDQYRLVNILAIPIFALTAIICYIVQSVMKDIEWKKYKAEHPEEAKLIQQQRNAQAVSAANSVGDYDIYRLSVLRGSIASIFGRILVSVLLAAFVGTGVLIWYIWVSYTWFFIKLTRNYIIGIGVCLFCVYYFADKYGNFPQPWATISAAAFICGVFVIDLINIIRYIALKNKIRKAGTAIKRLSREQKKAFRNAK